MNFDPEPFQNLRDMIKSLSSAFRLFAAAFPHMQKRFCKLQNLYIRKLANILGKFLFNEVDDFVLHFL